MVRSYVIPKYSKTVDKAKAFLLYLADNYDQAVSNANSTTSPRSTTPRPWTGLPAWAKKLSDSPVLDDRSRTPANKLALLNTAVNWSTNVGHPGPANAAETEVFTTFVLPNMMAAAARGTPPKDAVAQATTQVQAIFAKWRKQGLVGGTS